MNEDKPIIPGDHDKPEPGLTPDPASAYREGDVIHTAPEFAVADADVLAPERGDMVEGSSLWRDAWRRLLKNKLAVFGLIVVGLVTIASLGGPYIIERLTGHAPDYIPADAALIKSFP